MNLIEFDKIVIVLKGGLEIIGLTIGAFIAFRIYWKFIPIINLKIESEWIDKVNGKLKLVLTIENKGAVKAIKDVALLQIFQYPLSQTNELPEYVAVFEDELESLGSKSPNAWHPPIEFWRQSLAFYQSRSMSTEHLCSCPPNSLLHICLFVSTRTDYGFKILKRKKTRRAKIQNQSQIRILDFHESWATTKIVANLPDPNVSIP